MSVREVREPLARWSAAGQRAGVATLVRVRRSAPRPPGARFAVSEEGEVAGSVSSGCVEGDLFERLRRTIEGAPSEVVQYGITDEMAMDVGLSCGGEIEVLLAAHDARDPAWQALARPLEEARPVVLITGLSPDLRGRRLLLGPDGPLAGTLGSGPVDDEARRETRVLFDVGGARVLELVEGGGEVFAEAFLPPARLAIVGASPVAVALSHLARYAGFEVSVVDPRETFADPARFPDARRVIHAWPEEALEEIGLDRYLNVVVLAHDTKLDVPALAAALRAGCLYVGQIGGGRTQRLRREALRELGFEKETVARVHGPVGLDIGAETPEEIAVSILAEILAVRRGKQRAG